MKITKNISRRGFVGLTAGLSASTAMGQNSIFHLLQTPDGFKIVTDIIRRYYGSAANQTTAVQSFHQSLVDSSARFPEFQELLNRADMNQRLQAFIIEEFPVRTNYFEWASGETHALSLIS